jgi:hypothetical protein
MPMNVPYYPQSPHPHYLAMSGGGAGGDPYYSQHTLAMAHSPTVGMAYLQSPYASQPMAAPYLSYGGGDDSQRQQQQQQQYQQQYQQQQYQLVPPPPMYLNQSPPSRPVYYQSHHGVSAPRAGVHDPSVEAQLTQSFEHSLRLSAEGGA